MLQKICFPNYLSAAKDAKLITRSGVCVCTSFQILSSAHRRTCKYFGRVVAGNYPLVEVTRR